MSSQNINIADYEEVLRVLPESFLESWKNNPDVLVYLSDLGSLGLQRLGQEPERLAEEKATVLEQTQDLAFHNYKTFIQAADCSHTIFKDFNVIETRLDHLLNKLPLFKGKCGDFGNEAQMINARWRQASSTLSKHTQLLEFLEIPQLMNNCIKDCLYDEALELSTYVKRLERKNMDISLIKSIVEDVQSAYNVMLTNLLTKLQTNIQLPECLKVVGYLRRMDVFSEPELRIKFLQARDTWFHKVINDIPKHDPYEHITKVIENSRVHIFDIITQYRAIFSDDDPLMLMKEDSKNNCAIFHSWMTWKISWFLSVLKKDLSANVTGKIDSLLTQCMYFGLSFSRVNIDFRPLLVPIFENVAIQKFNIALKKAIYNFESTMKTYTFSTYSNPTFAPLPEESLQPPISLLDFYPLAQYYNEILAGLNELKLCSSFSMSSNILFTISNSLKQVVKILVTIHSKRNRVMNELENENFNRLCFLFSTDLISHLNKCLNIIFPPEELAQVLGITPLELQKMDHLYKLNSEEILSPLQTILPARDDDIGLVIKIKESVAEKATTLFNNQIADVPLNNQKPDMLLPSEEITSSQVHILNEVSKLKSQESDAQCNNNSIINQKLTVPHSSDKTNQDLQHTAENILVLLKDNLYAEPVVEHEVKDINITEKSIIDSLENNIGNSPETNLITSLSTDNGKEAIH